MQLSECNICWQFTMSWVSKPTRCGWVSAMFLSQAMTALNQKITDLEITDATMSEVTRLFLFAHGEKQVSPLSAACHALRNTEHSEGHWALFEGHWALSGTLSTLRVTEHYLGTLSILWGPLSTHWGTLSTLRDTEHSLRDTEHSLRDIERKTVLFLQFSFPSL